MRFTLFDDFDKCCSRELVGGDGRSKLRHGAWSAADTDGHTSLAVETTVYVILSVTERAIAGGANSDEWPYLQRESGLESHGGSGKRK
jgi:hypothetical protein